MSDFKDESYVEMKDETFEKPGWGSKILGCMKKFLLAIIAAALLALLVFQLILISAIGEVKAIPEWWIKRALRRRSRWCQKERRAAKLRICVKYRMENGTSQIGKTRPVHTQTFEEARYIEVTV